MAIASGYPEEPGPRGGAPPELFRRFDRGDEDLRRQVGGALTVADPTGDEALYVLEMLAVEGVEERGVATDPADLRGAHPMLAGGDHTHPIAESAGRMGQRIFLFHTP